MGPHAGGAVPGPPGAAPGCHVVAASAGFQGPPCWASLWLSSLPPACPEPAPRPPLSPISTCSVVSKSLLSTCPGPRNPAGRGGGARRGPLAELLFPRRRQKRKPAQEQRNGTVRGAAGPELCPRPGPERVPRTGHPRRQGAASDPDPGGPEGAGVGEAAVSRQEEPAALKPLHN